MEVCWRNEKRGMMNDEFGGLDKLRGNNGF